ncbi:MAG: sigma-70 family RNA polymerase sigma factor [Acidobacteria bacterium]|nr:sigma-70 family RNA polymerase sigma factor [Acidobacteriota bacterium]
MIDGTAWQNEMRIAAAERRGEEFSKSFERSDRQLIEFVLMGDESAFEELFDRHKRLVARVAARYFREPEQIEEIIQIVFAKTYFELGNFRGAYDLSLAGWLSKVTANASLDILRQQKRRPDATACEITEIEQTILHSAAEESAQVSRDLADKLLSCLAAEDRVLLRLLYADEMSIAEAAAIMQWSKSKTKMRAWRARNLLRKILKRFV